VTIIRDAAGRYFASFVVDVKPDPLPASDTEVGVDLGLTHFAVLWQHKLSTTIVRDNQAVYVEDLAVAGLARTRMARSVHDAGWSAFVNMLEYKATLYGRGFGRVDRWLPSTRTCSACGGVGQKLPLATRHWTCGCGARHDRDVNAALNVLAAGRAESLTACGGTVSPSA
jgi:putative transposase